MDLRKNNSWSGGCTADHRRRRALTVLELLVVMSIIGVLAALLLPALMYARESARRTLCTSHLRQVGIALHSHHHSHRRLPAAWRMADRDPDFAYGWAAELLAEIEQTGLHQTLDVDRRPGNLNTLRAAAKLSLPLLLCPSDITENSFELLRDMEDDEELHAQAIVTSAAVTTPSPALIFLPTTNYLGVFGTVEADDFDEHIGQQGVPYGDGTVINEPRVRFCDLRRGLSNTLVVGERTMAAVPSTWLGVDMRGEDAGCRLTGSAITSPNCDECDECEFSSRHAGGSNFLWADGRVTMITDSIDRELYRRSAKRNP